MTNGIKYADGSQNHAATVAIIMVISHQHIRLDVIDNGIGIPKNEHKAIFEALYQLDNLENDNNKGMGLGLSIVRRTLSVLKNHSIKLTSKPHLGTRFSLKIPKKSSVAIVIDEFLK